jgi:hypothetical protein
MLFTLCSLLALTVNASEQPATVTVPNISVFMPSNAAVRNAFGSTWTSVGFRNRPDWTRRDIVYSPDIRFMSGSGSDIDGTKVLLVPAFLRGTLQLGQEQRPVKLALFAEAGLLGAYTSGNKSRFTAAPALGIGVSVSRSRLDIEAQYLLPASQDGRDFAGFAVGFGYRL